MGKGMGATQIQAAGRAGHEAFLLHNSRGPHCRDQSVGMEFCVRRPEAACGWGLPLSESMGPGIGGGGDITLPAPLGSVLMTPMLSAPAQSLSACPTRTATS